MKRRFYSFPQQGGQGSVQVGENGHNFLFNQFYESTPHVFKKTFLGQYPHFFSNWKQISKPIFLWCYLFHLAFVYTGCPLINCLQQNQLSYVKILGISLTFKYLRKIQGFRLQEIFEIFFSNSLCTLNIIIKFDYKRVFSPEIPDMDT